MQCLYNFKTSVFFLAIGVICAKIDSDYDLSNITIKAEIASQVINNLKYHITNINEYYSNDNDSKNLNKKIVMFQQVLTNWNKNNSYYPVLMSLRDDINYIHHFYKDSTNCLVSKICPNRIKNQWIQEIADPSSEYRQILSSIEKNYINSNDTFRSEKFLFSLVLNYFKSKVNYLRKFPFIFLIFFLFLTFQKFKYSFIYISGIGKF